MKGFLLDTCAISEFAKPSPNLGLVAWLSRIDVSLLFLSSLTIGEIRYGISLQPDRRKRNFLERWLSAEVLSDFQGRILAVDESVAQRWGRLRAQARTAGSPAPVIDALIAATALQHGLAVVTRNDADFERLGADVVNPWKA